MFAQRKEAEEQLRESEAQLAKKSAALARLHEVGTRLWHTRALRQALDEILAGAMELLGADMGIIRILDPTGGILRIEAHRGFKQEFIESFPEVSASRDSSCGRTLQSGERIGDCRCRGRQAFHTFAPSRPFSRRPRRTVNADHEP